MVSIAAKMSRRSEGAGLFVGRLSKHTRTRDLEDVFQQYGRMIRCDVKYGAEMAYAFVDFEDHRDAEDAIKYENGRDLNGASIIVEWAKGAPRRPLGYDECYRCHRAGHWARDCTEGYGGGGGGGGGGGRGGGYGGSSYGGGGGSWGRSRGRRSRSRSRDRRRRSRSRSPRRHRSRSRSPRRRSRSRSYDQSRRRRSPSRSPSMDHHKERSKSRSRSRSISPHENGDKNRGSRSPS